MGDEHAEYVINEITRQFHKALRAASDGHGVVNVDFSRLPREWRFALPQPMTIQDEIEPQTVNALDLIEATLPGLWGYAENAGMRKEEICTRCGKCVDAN